MTSIVIMIFMFYMAVVVHEIAHGWCALKLGDPTAKQAGRLTLNPLAHIDLYGTIILPVILTLMGATPIGWAKPVPINFRNLNNMRRDMALVGLAGPAANLTMAFISSIILKSAIFGSTFDSILYVFIFLNLVLAVLNLLPIPPLDGSRILAALLPTSMTYIFVSLERFGIIILIVFIWLGMFNAVILPIVKSLLTILGLPHP